MGTNLLIFDLLMWWGFFSSGHDCVCIFMDETKHSLLLRPDNKVYSVLVCYHSIVNSSSFVSASSGSCSWDVFRPKCWACGLAFKDTMCTEPQAMQNDFLLLWGVALTSCLWNTVHTTQRLKVPGAQCGVNTHPEPDLKASLSVQIDDDDCMSNYLITVWPSLMSWLLLNQNLLARNRCTCYLLFCLLQSYH